MRPQTRVLGWVYIIILKKVYLTICRVRCGAFEFCDFKQQQKFATRYYKRLPVE
jgi:hypothetical protein